MTDLVPIKNPLFEIERDIKMCQRCSLHHCRTKAVPGAGSVRASVFLIGEAPGQNEDREGLPFIGASGRKLNEWLKEAGLDREHLFITNVLKCLSGPTLVRLSDGSTRRIQQLVDERYDGEVLSVDSATGQFTPRKVVGWHRSPRGDRRMFKLRFKHGKGNPKGFAGARLTEDHKVLTEHGWLPVAAVPAGTRIATGCPMPGPRTQQMLYGSLLGDACVTGKLQISHCVGQAEWIGLKAAMLAPLKPTIESVPQNNAVALRTPAGPYWRWLRAVFYPEGKKLVPSALSVESVLTLATWFLDDGYLRLRAGRQPLAEIATNGFVKADVERLARQLNDRAIECRVRWGSGWRIKFTAAGTRALACKIAHLVPPSMRYKLHPEFHAVPFDATAYAPEAVTSFYDEAVIEESETSFTEASKTLFCIDVEGTHNFVTPGGVVHNCRPEENKFPEADEKDGPVDRCLPYLHEQLRIVKPLAILVAGKQALQHVVLRGTGENAQPFEKWVGRVCRRRDLFGEARIGVMFHPAHVLRSKNPREEAQCVALLKAIRNYTATKLRNEPAPVMDLFEVRPVETPAFQQKLRLFGEQRPS